MKKTKIFTTFVFIMLFLIPILPISVIAEPPPAGQGYGGTYRMDLKSEPRLLNSDLGDDYGGQFISSVLWPKLVAVDWGVIYGIPNATGGIQGDLASSWTTSADGKTFTFNLRKDAKWTDGKPITSEDVVFTYNWFLTNNKTRFHFKLKNDFGVTSVTAPDAYTVVMQTSKFNSDWLLVYAVQCVQGLNILPKHKYEGVNLIADPQKMSANVTGGPFILDTWAKGNYILLRKNPDYHVKPYPYVDKVLVKFIADANTAWAALQAGELDSISYELNPAYPILKQVLDGVYPDLIARRTGSIYSYPLKINHQNQYLSKLVVRQAIAYAINRNEIVSKGFYNLWPALVYYAHEGSPWINPNARAPDFDKAKAEKLLDDAGYKKGADGWRFELRLTAMPVTAPTVSAEIIKEQLQAIGIKIKYEMFDTPTITQKIYNGDFDLITEWTRYGPSPNDGYFNCWHSKGVYNKGRFRYNSTEYDQVVENALTLSDPAARKAAFWKAQEILARDVVEIPIVAEQKIQISQKDWNGLVATPDGWGRNGNWYGFRAVWNEKFVIRTTPTPTPTATPTPTPTKTPTPTPTATPTPTPTPSPVIPGFPAESILIGLVLAVAIFVIIKIKK